jgi:hypothetical protein
MNTTLPQVSHEETWDKCYPILERLYREGSDANVAQSTVIDGMRIGEWVYWQRLNYKAGKLSPYRIDRLEEIGFRWSMSDAKWEEGFAVLERFHREGQDVNVEQSVVIDGMRIGGWIEKQRAAYKIGKLSAERIARLETIGFKWVILALPTEWENRFAILEHLHSEERNVNVAPHVVIDGKKIGAWVIHQRMAHKAGQLSAVRIARLEAIGFKWKAFNSQWNNYFTILARLHREGQDVNVGQSVVVDGLRIGLWVYRQREAYMSGRLSAKLFAKLDAIGFTWPMKSKSF